MGDFAANVVLFFMDVMSMIALPLFIFVMVALIWAWSNGYGYARNRDVDKMQSKIDDLQDEIEKLKREK